jgi:4-hydroxyphenylpyruvate dioxygenase
VKTSIATVSIAGSLREKISAIARAGFDGLEIFENDFVASDLSAADFRKAMADHDLTLDLYQPFRDFEGVTEDQLAANLERARRKFSLMRDLGADTILACSNVGTASVNDNGLFVEQLSALAELAAEFEVKVAYEALAWGRYVSTYDHAWRLVEQVNHPNLGVCLDSFHILSRGTSLETIDSIPGEKIFFLQLADAPLMSLDVLSWSRHHRLFPGEGGWDIPDFVHRVLRAGYAGPLSLEIFNDVYRQGSPSVTARDGHRSLTYLQDQISELRKAEGLSDLGLTKLAQAQSPNKFEFVEFSPGEGDDLEQLVTGLGFKRIGAHPRKNAQAFAAGDARVVINSEITSATPQLVAVGLDFDSKSQVMDRMRGLQYGLIARDVAHGESDFGLVCAPNGINFHILESSDGKPQWTNDFAATTEAQPGDSAIIGIDHVAIREASQHADESTLFLRSALGLELQAELDLPSEYGLVRSRSANNPSRSVRLALNVAPELGNTAKGANHIAFASEDIFKTASFAMSNRLNLLPVPSNYYVDLKARLGLADEFVQRLSEHNILFDQDSNGQFLHFYAVQLGQVFVEVVQRFSGYDGYGAYNSFIRLASQRAQDLQRAVITK